MPKKALAEQKNPEYSRNILYIAELEYWGPNFLRMKFVLIFTPTKSEQLKLNIMVLGQHPFAGIVLPLIRPFLKRLLIQDVQVLRVLQDHKMPRYMEAASDVLGAALHSWFTKGVIERREETIELFL